MEHLPGCATLGLPERHRIPEGRMDAELHGPESALLPKRERQGTRIEETEQRDGHGFVCYGAGAVMTRSPGRPLAVPVV